MKIDKRTTTTGTIDGYALWLSAVDTSRWAHRPGQLWPCSHLSGKSIRLDVDSNGLADIVVNGRFMDRLGFGGAELDALVTDYLPEDCKHLWPCWRKTK